VRAGTRPVVLIVSVATLLVVGENASSKPAFSLGTSVEVRRAIAHDRSAPLQSFASPNGRADERNLPPDVARHATRTSGRAASVEQQPKGTAHRPRSQRASTGLELDSPFHRAPRT
jgi:hypothetical protein